MTVVAVPTPVKFEALEHRCLLSAGPEPIVHDIGSQEIRATAASADARTGQLLLAGSIATANDFSPGSAVHLVSPVGGAWSPFLARFGASGQPLWVNAFDIHSAYSDGATFPVISGVAAGPDGSVYAAGSFSGSIDFDISPNRSRTLTTNASDDGQPAHGIDAFIAKYDRNGKYLWSALINNVSTGAEAVTGLSVDRFGSAYLVGTYAPIVNGVAGTTQSFLTKFAANGGRAWSASLAGAVNTVAINRYDAPWVAVGGNGAAALPVQRPRPRGFPDERCGRGQFHQTRHWLGERQLDRL